MIFLAMITEDVVRGVYKVVTYIDIRRVEENRHFSTTPITAGYTTYSLMEHQISEDMRLP